jgi:hypothetical protein
VGWVGGWSWVVGAADADGEVGDVGYGFGRDFYDCVGGLSERFVAGGGLREVE